MKLALLKPPAAVSRPSPLSLPYRPVLTRPRVSNGPQIALPTSAPAARPTVQRFALSVADVDHKDPHGAGIAYRKSNPPETADDAITHCLKTLGQALVQLGGRDFVFQFKLPGAMIAPCPALLSWVKAGWGNYDWLATFTYCLLANRPSHPMQERAVYFHSYPPALKGTAFLPDFNTCPIKFIG